MKLLVKMPSINLQIYEASRLFSQSVGGFRLNQNWNTPRGAYEFNTDIILSAIMYASCAIHPILYFLVNPDYRAGLKVVWRELYCNKDPAQREREAAAKRQQRAMQRQQYSRPGSAGSNRSVKLLVQFCSTYSILNFEGIFRPRGNARKCRSFSMTVQCPAIRQINYILVLLLVEKKRKK